MKLRTVLREAIAGLVDAARRSAIALVGVAVGVGAVVAMTAVAASARGRAAADFRELGSDAIVVRAAEGTRAGRGGRLRAADARRLAAAAPALASAVAVIAAPVELGFGERRWPRTLLGAPPELARAQRLRLADGRFLSPLDAAASRCVVGRAVAADLRAAGARNLVGLRLALDGRPCTVVGELAAAASSPVVPWAIDDCVIVPLEAAARRLGRDDVDALVARLVPGADEARARGEIARYFRLRGAPPPEVASAEELLAALAAQTRLLSLVFAAVGAIGLLLGGVGVVNVMVLAVAQRQHEIGVRRALGARRRDIARQFLCEALLLVSAGGALGLGLGLGAAALVAARSQWTLVVPVESALLALAVTAATGLVCGWYPAQSAARLEPLDALRD